MPVFSLLLVLIIIYLLTSSKTQIDKLYNLFVLACALRIYWFQGYFLKIGDSEIANLGAVVETVFSAYAIYLIYINTIRIKRVYVVLFLFFALINLLGIILEILFPYDGMLLVEQSTGYDWDALVAGKCNMYNYYPTVFDYIKPYCSLLQFAFNVVLLKHVYDKEKIAKAYMKVIKVIKFGVFYGLFEFFMKNIIGNVTLTYDVSALAVGVNEVSAYNEAFMKNGLYALQGMTREPSHFNCFLFTYIFLTMLGNTILRYHKEYVKYKTYGNISIFIAVFLLLVSGGFSAVWYLFVLALSCFILKKNNGLKTRRYINPKMIFNLLFALILVVAIIYVVLQNDYIYGRLQDAFMIIDYLEEVDEVAALAVLDGNEGIGSTVARFFSTYTGMVIFMNRPLFGLGYNLQFMHSFSMMLLANMGIIGTYSVYKLLTYSNDRKYDVLLMFVVFIIGGLPITISPLGLSMHWLLFFEATTYYKIDNLKV